MVADMFQNLIRYGRGKKTVFVGPRVVFRDQREALGPVHVRKRFVQMVTGFGKIPVGLDPVIANVKSIEVKGHALEQLGQRLAKVVDQQSIAATDIEDCETVAGRWGESPKLGREHRENLQMSAAQQRRHLGVGRGIISSHSSVSHIGYIFGILTEFHLRQTALRDTRCVVTLRKGKERILTDMTILVTGGAGYIGSHMVLRFCDAGEDVVVYDNLSTGRRELVDPRAGFVEGALEDHSKLIACIRENGVKDVVHFAGSIIVPESIADPLKYYRNNTSVSRGLIDVAVQEGLENFIFSSTAAVYGSVGAEPVLEDAPKVPLSPYGTSKLMTEWMLRDVAHATDLKYGIFRYFNVAGADPHGRSGHSGKDATHLIKVACKAALGQLDHVAVFGSDFDTVDGTGVRDYIHVTDLVDAHALLLTYLRDGGENTTMNCGYGQGSTVRQVIAMVKDVSGVDFEVRDAPRRAGDPASVVANVERIHHTLDWTPGYNDLRAMIESAYAWELKTAER